jgi:uncharacterized protein YutE (UPF0331/DUF86 family)
LDRERVTKHLEDISSSLRILESLKPVSFQQFSEDPKIYWAVEKGLERCIQNLLDASAHIVAALGGPVPDNYGSLLLELGRSRILPSDFAARIAPMAGFRNILIHEYLEVDLREVYAALQDRLDDFRTFAHYVLRFLEANS